MEPDKKVWSRDHKDFGLTNGTSFPCTQDGCKGKRITVFWPKDGTYTYPCTKGIKTNDDGEMQII
jgi:hypothetical protein